MNEKSTVGREADLGIVLEYHPEATIDDNLS